MAAHQEVPSPDRESADPATSTAPRQTTLRRLRAAELSLELVSEARRIIMAQHCDPMGTEVGFSLAGKEYVGRIERHFHPVGGEGRPWGWLGLCRV